MHGNELVKVTKTCHKIRPHSVHTFSTMFPIHDLAKTVLFQFRSEGLPMHERDTLAYRRAQAIAQAYGSIYLSFLEYALTVYSQP